LKPIRWLVIVLLFTVLTLLATYLIQTEPLVYIRYVLGFLFIVFMPGYCLVNVLFLGKNRIDLIETLVLSIVLSFGLAGLIGLFLGLSPVGINFSSVTISLGVTVTALAVIAYLRKSKEKELPVLQVQSPEQVSA
jgi:Predicted membrane protein